MDFSPPHHQKEKLNWQRKKIKIVFNKFETCILLPLHHQKENLIEIKIVEILQI